MISILLYGRNDAHGYNLHRRVALSLNCLAEVLTDPDDEILFVDYGTPGELPTLVEALSDTLTERCLDVLRVLRVPAALHTQRYGARTHLPLVEPVSRNAAARRANPENRWLLSTNTDMILLPLVDQSLSEICRDLPDGFYGLPRFELPEWLWEYLPRSDPIAALAEIKRLGPGLRLDETTLSHEWIRFDAPGDFQLILREDFFAIDGFDEEMLVGWHVDSNLSRRMFMRRGSIDSLEERIAGYHCNHSRTPTIYHGAETPANDLDRFFYSIDRPEVPAQRESWGLADVALEEVNARRGVESGFATAVLSAAAQASPRRPPFDARDAKFALEYDSGHVLPFIADSLIVSPPDAKIAYIGTNSVLEGMLASLVAELDLGGPLVRARLEDSTSASEIDRIADVFVVDLGLDAAFGDVSLDDDSLDDISLDVVDGSEAALARAGLIRSFDTFRQLVELERRRLESGEHPRRLLLVNSSAVFWNAYALAHLNCSQATPHSRVRHATVKLQPNDDDATRAANVRALRLIRWMARRDLDQGRLHVRFGETVEVAELDDYAGFGEGWAYPDKMAVWTRGPRSELSITLDETCQGSCLLTLAFDEIGVRSEDYLRVVLLAGGARVAACEFPQVHRERGQRRSIDDIRDVSRRALRRPIAALVRKARALGVPGVDAAIGWARRLVAGPIATPNLTWRVMLPKQVFADGDVELTLAVQEPVNWSDDRRRGLRLQSLKLGEKSQRHGMRTILDTARARLPKRLS
ncbi:MAG: hypothetical protein M3546_00355 [Actinomycetota bacterium]|nr:hypothetical protein [Actinomycetota bacterium]